MAIGEIESEEGSMKEQKCMSATWGHGWESKTQSIRAFMAHATLEELQLILDYCAILRAKRDMGSEKNEMPKMR